MSSISPKNIFYESLALTNAPFQKALEQKFSEILAKGWYILGDEVAAFEQAFAEYCGNHYCVGVGNGLDALTISLMALDLPKGSEVIVPGNTFYATVLAVLRAGLKPKLIDPDPDTYNLTAERIEAAISPSTSAVMVVHLYGRLCPMPEIMALCQLKGLKLIEDAAQAHGAELHGKKAGSFGDMAAFSFYPTKNLGALGDGGAITTNNPDHYEKIKAIRNYGAPQKYRYEHLGMNSRLDELQAAFLRVKLPKLDALNQHKMHLAHTYDILLPNEPQKPLPATKGSHVYHIYNICHPERDRLKRFLEKNHVQTAIHYPLPPHQQKALQNQLGKTELPITENIHETTLSLPLSFAHSTTDIEYVSGLISEFFQKKS